MASNRQIPVDTSEPLQLLNVDIQPEVQSAGLVFMNVDVLLMVDLKLVSTLS